MALETKPFPELTGQAAADFLEKVENFKITQTKEDIQRIKQAVRKSLEKSRRLGIKI
jgi:chromosome condensin MukBEF MukE localization factor